MDDGMQRSGRPAVTQRYSSVRRQSLAAAPILAVLLALAGCSGLNAQQTPANQAQDATAAPATDDSGGGGRGVTGMKPGDVPPVKN